MRNLALCYVWIDQSSKALKIAEELIREAPNDHNSYYVKAQVLIRGNRTPDALEVYPEILARVPEKDIKRRAQVLTSLSNALLVIGKADEALTKAEEAIKLDPEYQVALLNKATALKKLNRTPEAHQLVTDILPKFKSEYFRACAFAILGKRGEMLKTLETAIKQDAGYRVYANSDPDFENYRDDPEFRKLVYAA